MVRPETIGSWREFDDAVATASAQRLEASRVHSALVFRGLARATYPNVSSLARLGAEAPGLERHLVRNFRKYAHRERPGPAVWDWLSLAQHHGLPTRLLDWTFSPLVAAHFATATSAEHDAIVWAVDCERAHQLLPSDLARALRGEGATVFTTELLHQHAPTLEAFDALSDQAPFALFFEPPSLDDRIINQSAVFSALSDAAASMEDWLRTHTDLWHAWRITVEGKAEIRARLDQANVTERVLMPGLDGLAAWLRRYYRPGRADRGSAEGGETMGDPIAIGTDQGEAG